MKVHINYFAIIVSFFISAVASAQTRTVQYAHDMAGNRTRQEVARGALEHLLAVENPPGGEDYQRHNPDNDEPCPAETVQGQAHIHSIETGDESRRHQEHAYEREDLHDVVLFEVDKADHGILKVLQPLEHEIDVIDK